MQSSSVATFPRTLFATLLALLCQGAGCNQELGLEKSLFACTSDGDCLSGYTCVSLSPGSSTKVCRPFDASLPDQTELDSPDLSEVEQLDEQESFDELGDEPDDDEEHNEVETELAPECTTAQDCGVLSTGAPSGLLCIEGRCEPCARANDCLLHGVEAYGATPICVAGHCQRSCTKNNDCASNRCSSGLCAACTMNEHCEDNEHCDPVYGTCLPGECTRDADCVDDSGDCNAMYCVQSNGGGQCVQDSLCLRLSCSTTEPWSCTQQFGLSGGEGTAQDPELSANGRYVVFASTGHLGFGASQHAQIYRRDLYNSSSNPVDALECISALPDKSLGNAASVSPSISNDGCVIAYTSEASNLVEGDDNGVADVFVWDCHSGTTRRLVPLDGSSTNAPSQHARVSGNGRCVVFDSAARQWSTDDRLSYTDVFRYDLWQDQLRRISVLNVPDGTEGFGNASSAYPDISDDCRFVAFESEASNLLTLQDNSERSRVYRADCILGCPKIQFSLVSIQNNTGTVDEANAPSSRPSISASGRYIAYQSSATNLGGGSTETPRVYHRDMHGNAQSLGETYENAIPRISGDGRFTLFLSQAPLLEVDLDTLADVYVADIDSGTTSLGLLSLDQEVAELSHVALAADGYLAAFVKVSTTDSITLVGVPQ